MQRIKEKRGVQSASRAYARARVRSQTLARLQDCSEVSPVVIRAIENTTDCPKKSDRVYFVDIGSSRKGTMEYRAPSKIKMMAAVYKIAVEQYLSQEKKEFDMIDSGIGRFKN